ncbi:hypothetical protein BEP19_05325 [Ammoniphilus oxalaticus]|uniref:Uncharacterized protein n=1 Tax=Ammoniphilus oxalaticus TaxID=66863 RepID=A0A419SIS5_9BACL|nr:polysaccharide biosynthesis protein [Ammoniphilus oxalaticus]RKD23852.1 hypothetical protein BEP19_05325 [Ammoniphilus oxalaticus]
MSRQVFLKGAIALSVAAFVSKLLGLFYVIPLKHFAGNEGLALYQLVFPIYNTILILSVSGIPIAISKLISKNLMLKREAEIAVVMKSAFRLMVFVSIGGFLLFFFGSSRIAGWIGNHDTKLSIQALAFAMLVVPFVALLRGYFNGCQQMVFSASSQVIEQLVRVSAMTYIVYLFMRQGKGVAVAAAGAAFGSFFGLTIALLSLLYAYFRLSRNQGDSLKRSERRARYGWRILVVSIPVSLSSLMIPVIGMIDSVSVIHLLQSGGLSNSLATEQFGIYSRGVPIVQFSSFYATGLALAVVPALASAATMREKRAQIRKALQVTVLIGLPASVGMVLIAHPLNILFYGDAHGSATLQALAAATFFLSLAVSASGVLQGLSKQFYPALFLLAGMVAKISGNVLLIRQWGIQGAAYATLLAYVIMSVLCLWAIYASLQKNVRIGWELVKWFQPTALMSVVLIALITYFPHSALAYRSQVFASVMWLVAAGVTSYGCGLMLFKVIAWSDVKRYLKRIWRKPRKSGV